MPEEFRSRATVVSNAASPAPQSPETDRGAPSAIPISRAGSGSVQQIRAVMAPYQTSAAPRSPAEMISDRDIWAAALPMIKRYGDDAVASQRADKLQKEGQ